jgi:cob(I)alamin adenosyltransferase
MKIYTKGGDEGDTTLLGGVKVRKTDPRVILVGKLDEINSLLGLAAAQFQSAEFSNLECAPVMVTVGGRMHTTQHALFDIGAWVASIEKEQPYLLPDLDVAVNKMEQEIDKLEELLPKLTEFILPGGCMSAAFLHHARTAVRSTELEMVAFRDSPILHSKHFDVLDKSVLPWINRLSDWLFVAARWTNLASNQSDVTWNK